MKTKVEMYVKTSTKMSDKYQQNQILLQCAFELCKKNK